MQSYQVKGDVIFCIKIVTLIHLQFLGNNMCLKVYNSNFILCVAAHGSNIYNTTLFFKWCIIIDNAAQDPEVSPAPSRIHKQLLLLSDTYDLWMFIKKKKKQSWSIIYLVILI